MNLPNTLLLKRFKLKIDKKKYDVAMVPLKDAKQYLLSPAISFLFVLYIAKQISEIVDKHKP